MASDSASSDLPSRLRVAYRRLASHWQTVPAADTDPADMGAGTRPVATMEAADVYREKVVGVLLTGASVDGARGAHRIKQQGDWLIVQDPATAESRARPEAGLAATQADEVVAIDRIAESLRHLAAVV